MNPAIVLQQFLGQLHPDELARMLGKLALQALEGCSVTVTVDGPGPLDGSIRLGVRGGSVAVDSVQVGSAG